LPAGFARTLDVLLGEYVEAHLPAVLIERDGVDVR